MKATWVHGCHTQNMNNTVRVKKNRDGRTKDGIVDWNSVNKEK